MHQGYDMAELVLIRVEHDFLNNLIHIIERLKEGCNHDEQQNLFCDNDFNVIKRLWVFQ